MTMADDVADLLSVWGQTLTVVRASMTAGDTGEPVTTWSTVATATGRIHPIGGDTANATVGDKDAATHMVILPNGTSIRGGDRVRPNGWVAGDDEYRILHAAADAPSHVSATANLVRGGDG